jgi:hypothetical protein
LRLPLNPCGAMIIFIIPIGKELYYFGFLVV